MMPERPPDQPAASFSSTNPAAGWACEPPPPIPDHELLGRIGGGSYGEVWLARNVLGVYRAVKIVYRQRFEDDRPFEREFAGIQRFEPVSRLHESQVDILHVGRNSRCFYYVMELADDQKLGRNIDPGAYTPRTLRNELVRRGRLPMEECLLVASSLATALEHIHQHGLVHRDIKPSNIIFIDGAPRLADIGLVAGVDASRSYVGTEGYIPPEGPGTPQADLFSLGKVLYEISTGKDRRDFPEPPVLPEGTAEERAFLEFQEILLKACETDPRRRYQEAREMRADLELLQVGKSVKRLHLLERRLAVLTRLGLIAVALLFVVAPACFFTAHEGRKAQREARRADKEAAHAKLAEQRAREELFQAYLAQAQARRSSSRAGRRFESLEAIRRAAEIHRSIEPRSEALASLALPDLHTLREWDGVPGTTLLAFDHDYERYARGDEHGDITVCRVADGVELVRLAGEGERVESCLAFSPDKRWLGAMYGTESLKLRIWDLAQRKVFLEILDRHCRSFDFSPDSRFIAVAQHNGPIEVYELESGRVVHSLAQQVLPYSLLFHPDGRQLAVSSAESAVVEIRDVETGAVLQSLTASNIVRGLAWNATGTLLAAACSDYQVYVWDTVRSGLRFRLAGHQGAVVTLIFHPHSELLASYAWDGQLHLWDLRSGRTLVTQPAQGGWGFSSDGGRIAWTTHAARVSLGEVATGRECRQLASNNGSTRNSTGCEFSPDGRWLVTAHNDGIRLWDVASAREVAFESENDVRCVRFRPSGDAVFTCGRDGSKRWPVLATDDTQPPHFGPPKRFGGRAVPLEQCSLSRDGSTVAVNCGKEIFLLDADTGGLKARAEANPVPRLTAFDPGARWIATATSPAATVQVRDLATHAIAQELAATNAASLACDARGQWLVISSSHDYRFFDTTTWQLRFSTPREDSPYLPGCVAFAPDGRLAVVTHSACALQMLELPSGRALATFEMPEAPIITALSFSPDGALLAVSTRTPPVHLWDLRLLRQQLRAMNLDWEPAASGRAK